MQKAKFEKQRNCRASFGIGPVWTELCGQNDKNANFHAAPIGRQLWPAFNMLYGLWQRGGGVTGKGTDGRSVNTRVKQDLHVPCVSRRSRLLYHQWHHHHDGNRHLFLIIEKVNSSDVCDLSVGHARRDDDGRGKSTHAYHIRMSLLRIAQAVRLSAALLWRENGIPGCCARAPAWRSEQACILTDSASLQRSKLHRCFTN